MSDTDATELRMPAKLFSSEGKLAVTVSRLSAFEAMMSAETLPAVASIAVLARNGIRICGTVLDAADGRARIEFERPINAREQEMFWGSGAPLELRREEALPAQA